MVPRKLRTAAALGGSEEASHCGCAKWFCRDQATMAMQQGEEEEELAIKVSPEEKHAMDMCYVRKGNWYDHNSKLHTWTAELRNAARNAMRRYNRWFSMEQKTG